MSYKRWAPAALAVTAGWSTPATAQQAPATIILVPVAEPAQPPIVPVPPILPVALMPAAPPPAVPAADEAMPVAPAKLAATFATPAQDEGGYRTPNRDITADEVTWHVRVALNVAALGCRGAGEDATVAAYNALLAGQRDGLASAQGGTERAYQSRAGAAWRARYDDEMTRLYNFWAQTPAHDEFCQAAASVLREAATVPAAGLSAFATAALPRLEAPFTRFYAAWDAYAASLARWNARHPQTLVIASVAALPVSPAGTPGR